LSSAACTEPSSLRDSKKSDKVSRSESDAENAAGTLMDQMDLELSQAQTREEKLAVLANYETKIQDTKEEIAGYEIATAAMYEDLSRFEVLKKDGAQTVLVGISSAGLLTALEYLAMRARVKDLETR